MEDRTVVAIENVEPPAEIVRMAARWYHPEFRAEEDGAKLCNQFFARIVSLPYRPETPGLIVRDGQSDSQAHPGPSDTSRGSKYACCGGACMKSWRVRNLVIGNFHFSD